MSDPEERPFGAIFWFEGLDLVVTSSVESAEGYIEPFDIDVGEIYDERGRRLKARVLGEGWPKRIRIAIADAEPHIPALIDRVSEFMAWKRYRAPETGDPTEWLREAASILTIDRSGRHWWRRRRPSL